jgi:shikimate kinase
MTDSIHTNKKSLIFLTGFMGSGKSTIGPILANTLGFRYIDVDTFIEEKANKKVVDIFSADGEQAFRKLEKEALRELAELDHCIISLGGGTIANEENSHFVLENGTLVYLKLSTDEIIQRVQHRNDRPMLKDEKGNALPAPLLRERIRELLARREKFYARANIIINADNMRVGSTVDEIVRQLRSILNKE